MIKLLLLAVIPFMTEHRNILPKTEVSTNFYGSVTGIVDNAYIESHGGGGIKVETDPTVPAWAKEDTKPSYNASEVGALPDNKEQLEENDNFREAVSAVSPPVVLPEKWALADVTNKTGGTVSAADVGAMPDTFEEQDPTATAKAQAEILAQGLDKAVKTDDDGIIQEEIEFGSTVKIRGMLQMLGNVGIGVGGSEYDADGIYVYHPQQGIEGEMFYFPWYRPSGWESDKRHFFASVADVPEVVSPSSTSTVEQAASALSTYNQIAAATNGLVSASNPAFSSAVLAVGLDIDADTLQWLKDIGAIAQSTTGQVGLGTLLAALLAALMWLKANKVQTLKLEDESIVKTAENGVAKLDDFFKESNSFTPPTTVAGALKNSLLEKSIVLAVTENFADADTTAYGGQN